VNKNTCIVYIPKQENRMKKGWIELTLPINDVAIAG
jgi:hypothetical protein